MYRKTVSGIVLMLLLTSMLSSAFNIQPVEAEPATWTVDDDLLDYPDADFTKIQDAVDAAGARDAVIVYPGTYIENVRVNKDHLTIESENGAEATIVEAASRNAHVFQVYFADYVNIDGFAVKGTVSTSEIELDSADYCRISNNIFSKVPYSLVGWGLDLLASNNVNIINNRFKNSGILISGDELSNFNTHTIERNIINGKPIYYYRNEKSLRVPDNAGEVILANCTDMTVESTYVSFTGVGIELAYTANSKISNNTISSNDYGIVLIRSDNNVITHNEVMSSWDLGILVRSSNNNEIANNNVSKNEQGILLYSSSDNILANNNVSNNDQYGIWMLGTPVSFSFDNRIYHNNFINNTLQVYSYMSTNLWDDGYPSGGNYWSDYTDVDLYSSPYQNETGGDGIWDHPYVIDADNQDRYPLTSPWRERGESPWPMFQHDAQHTGRSPYVGPSKSPEAEILLGNQTVDEVFGSPVFGSDGTLYFGKVVLGGEWGLCAHHPSGVQRWFYEIQPVGGATSLLSPPAFFESAKTVYAHSDLEIFAIDMENGNLRWQRSFARIHSFLVVAENGILYFTALRHLPDDSYRNYLIGLNENGEEVLSYELGERSLTPSSPTIDHEGPIYVGFNNTLFAINPNGTERWRRAFEAVLEYNPPSPPTVTTPSIADDGTIYVVVQHESDGQNWAGTWYNDHLHAIDPENPSEDRWTRGLKATSLSRPRYPVIDSNGNVYVANWRGVSNIQYSLVALSPQGTQLWTQDFTGYDSPGLLLVDAQSTVYVLRMSVYGSATLHMFNAGGNQTSISLPFQEGHRQPFLSLSSDGTLYIGGHKNLYAVKSAVVPPPVPTQPPQAVNIEPPDGATDVSLEPMFLSSPPLSDVDEEQIPWEIDGEATRVYYQVQITTVPGDYSDSLYDFTDFWLIDKFFDFPPSPKSPYVSSEVLDYGTTYYWRIRYKDFRDVWSPWSEETSFTTEESRRMKITRLITEEAIGGVPVTVNDEHYVIRTLESHIDPITLEVTPDVLTNVYVEAAENYPVSDPETARRIGIIDYSRSLAENAEQIQRKVEVLMALQDFYTTLRASDLAMSAINVYVSGTGLIKDTKTIFDVLENTEIIESVGTELPSSWATSGGRFAAKLIELAMRLWIYDPMKELENEFTTELTQAIESYNSALEIIETGDITDHSTANSFLSSYLSAEANKENIAYLFGKFFDKYIMLIEQLVVDLAALILLPQAAIFTGFVYQVREAMGSLDWTIELLYRQIIASYENFATRNYKLLASTRYTLELAGTLSELIHEYDIKYTEYVAEGYKEAEKAVEKVITPMIPFFMRISRHSPAELRVYDSYGRVTGLVNGEEKSGIPYSFCHENTIIILSSNDSYRYEVAGTEKGSYGLEVERISLEENETITFTSTDIPILADAIHQYTIDWEALSLGEEGVTVQVDSDGDGAFEHTFSSGSELTQSEYEAAINAINTWITDSDFNEIESFRTVFTPYGNTEFYKLTATKPGQFHFNILVNNTWPEPKNMTIDYSIDPNFTTQGARPIHVYADLNCTIDITPNCTFSDNTIIIYNLAPNATAYVTIHLDYVLKGTTWTTKDVEAWYSEHAFKATVGSISSKVVITDP